MRKHSSQRLVGGLREVLSVFRVSRARSLRSLAIAVKGDAKLLAQPEDGILFVSDFAKVFRFDLSHSVVAFRSNQGLLKLTTDNGIAKR